VPQISSSNGIALEFETHGNPGDPPVLLVMGFGTQLINWPRGFAQAIADGGRHVITFDNRDCGLSQRFDGVPANIHAILGAAGTGDFNSARELAPYLLSDMSDDGLALLSALGIDRAHVVGASMGGMIAQTIAIEHPDRVLTLTSIMSTTGEPDVGGPDPEILGSLLPPAPTSRDEAVAQRVEVSRVISSPDHFDEDRARALAARSYDRDPDVTGTPRQLLAIAASGSRADGLAGLDVPTLVVHGAQDRLVNPTGGRRTAELVPGADLLVIDDMAHDLPPAHWARLIEAVTALAGSVPA
jgi:pimeloyl-ACP methyl ester carboxylesterase